MFGCGEHGELRVQNLQCTSKSVRFAGWPQMNGEPVHRVPCEMAPGGSGASELRPRRDGTRWLGKNLELPRGERGATMEGAAATVGDSLLCGARGSGTYCVDVGWAGKRAGEPPCFAADWARLGKLGKFHKDLPSAPFLTNPGHTRSRAHPCTITYVYLSIILSFEGVHGIPCLSYKHSTCRDSPPRLQILDFTFCFEGHPADTVLSQLAAHRFILIVFLCSKKKKKEKEKRKKKRKKEIRKNRPFLIAPLGPNALSTVLHDSSGPTRALISACTSCLLIAGACAITH
ncbi:hypothetical protein B0T13DRAFT_176169 [Neurospora crassa]|nr:hypothetical protein B0T13DRAFT_176169 [Neurospora crassa]